MASTSVSSCAILFIHVPYSYVAIVLIFSSGLGYKFPLIYKFKRDASKIKILVLGRYGTLRYQLIYQ